MEHTESLGVNRAFQVVKHTTGVEGGGRGRDRLSWVTHPPGRGSGGAMLCGTLELRCPVSTGAALGLALGCWAAPTVTCLTPSSVLHLLILFHLSDPLLFPSHTDFFVPVLFCFHV